MEVSSAITGRRGVALPFTDWCPALADDPEEIARLQRFALDFGRSRGWRYAEFRGNIAPPLDAETFLEFYAHRIDLRLGADKALSACTPAVRRGIRKAEAHGLRVEIRNDRQGLLQFWSLHVRTRRKHGLPPQPFLFFENIHRHVFAAGQGFIVVASIGERPIAAAVFFAFGAKAIYKFGASDPTLQHLRPNNIVMWEAIRHLAGRGYAELHLGRTSLCHDGLRRFKLGFGAVEEQLRYFRFDYRSNRYVHGEDRVQGWYNSFFRWLPPVLLNLAGRIIYPHLS
jgi:hypothetical protein